MGELKAPYQLTDLVEVPMWTVVMAIRYGQGRLTVANDEAAVLARRFWNQFPPFIREQVIRDAQMLPAPLERAAWLWCLDMEEYPVDN